MFGGRSEASGRLVGTSDGPLRFDRLLGRGGIGEVYEATELGTARRVAVKTLLPAFRNVNEAVRRMEREAKAGGLIDHPNIADVIGFGILSDGTPYLVMELIEGVDLAALLGDGALEPRRALGILRQALEGVGHAHALGILHRDLKPENIMVARGPDGAELVKILDFGIAKLVGLAASELGSEKLTETGAIFGTPAYMAPEQALGRPAAPGTDLYTLGVILFEMITGRRPFVGTDVNATLRMQISAPVPELVRFAPWCTAELDDVIRRALQKSPAARFATASEMCAAVLAAERSLG